MCVCDVNAVHVGREGCTTYHGIALLHGLHLKRASLFKTCVVLIAHNFFSQLFWHARAENHSGLTPQAEYEKFCIQCENAINSRVSS